MHKNRKSQLYFDILKKKKTTNLGGEWVIPCEITPFPRSISQILFYFQVLFGCMRKLQNLSVFGHVVCELGDKKNFSCIFLPGQFLPYFDKVSPPSDFVSLHCYIDRENKLPTAMCSCAFQIEFRVYFVV